MTTPLPFEVLRALRDGTATPAQQADAARDIYRLKERLRELELEAARGRHVVDTGSWIRRDADDRDPAKTWIQVEVDPDANLASRGSRADALDAEIARQRP